MAAKITFALAAIVVAAIIFMTFGTRESAVHWKDNASYWKQQYLEQRRATNRAIALSDRCTTQWRKGTYLNDPD